MKSKIRIAIGLFFILTFSICLTGCQSPESSAKKGIIVAVNDNYANTYFIASLAHLRLNLKCKLPIEIWHSGDELSDTTKEIINKFANVSFRDISKVLKVDPALYRGFQIKPKIVELTNFDEVILMDADIFFFEDPEMLFNNPDYKQTGAYFFSDLGHQFPVRGDDMLFTLNKYLKRRSFIKSLVPVPSKYALKDMKEMWTNQIPTFEKPFIGDMQESGCVAINKLKHEKSLEQILKLNNNRDHTYQFIYGDKESFWLGCEIAGEPYHMNAQRPLTLLSGNQIVTIMQFLNNKLFFQQKNPIPVDTHSVFIKYARQFVVYIPGQEPSKIEVIRTLTDEEQSKITAALQMNRTYFK